MTFDEDSRRKLVGLLGRLGSDNDNEILAAVKLIEAGRKAMDKQWDDLITKPVSIVAFKAGPLDFNTAPPARQSTSQPTNTRGTILDVFDSVAEFEGVLCAAEDAATTDKERDFVSDMRDRFETYGERTFLSAAQLAWLRSLAGD